MFAMFALKPFEHLGPFGTIRDILQESCFCAQHPHGHCSSRCSMGRRPSAGALQLPYRGCSHLHRGRLQRNLSKVITFITPFRSLGVWTSTPLPGVKLPHLSQTEPMSPFALPYFYASKDHKLIGGGGSVCFFPKLSEILHLQYHFPVPKRFKDFKARYPVVGGSPAKVS